MSSVTVNQSPRLRGSAPYLFALAAFGFIPLVALHLSQLWQKPEYQYFPFVLFSVGWLLWSRTSVANPDEAGTPKVRLAIFLCLVAFALLIAATAVWSPWMATVAAIVALLAVALNVRKRLQISNFLGIWALLWLVVPLPLNLDQALTQVLQRASSRVSSMLLDWVGVYHAMDGVVLLLPSKSFFVDEACSGIVSLFSILAAGAIFVVYKDRPFVHAVLLLLTGIGWAALMNVVRISAIALAFSWFHFDLSEGSPHQVLGLLLFLLTFQAFVATDQLLLFALRPVGKQSSTSRRLTGIFNRLASLGTPLPRAPERADVPRPRLIALLPNVPVWLAALAVLLAAAQLWVFPWEYFGRTDVTWMPAVESFDAELLSQALPDWTLRESKREQRARDDIFGEYSLVYLLSHPTLNNPLHLSIDFPFRDNHELTICYRNVGWRLNHRAFTEDKSYADWPYIAAEFTKDDSQHGLLYFCHVEGTGHPISSQTSDPLSGTRWQRRFRELMSTEPRNRLRNIGVIQLQAWHTQSDAVSQEQRQHINEAFRAFRSLVLSEFRKALAKEAARGEKNRISVDQPLRRSERGGRG